jgi:hypothetical protein
MTTLDPDIDIDVLPDPDELAYYSEACLTAVNTFGTTHTNPFHGDTDGDLVPDLYDDMTDENEINIHGTDPCNDDTDGDGFLYTFDSFEIYGPDANLNTGDELDPLNPDTDGDGMWDGFEMDFWLIRAGLDPSSFDVTSALTSTQIAQLQSAVYNTQTYDVDGDNVPDGLDSDPEDPTVWESGYILSTVSANFVKADGTPGQQLLEGVWVYAYDLDDPCVKEHAPSGVDVVDNQCGAEYFCQTNSDGQCTIPAALDQYFIMVKSLNHPGKYPSQTVPVTKIDRFKFANFSFLAE